MTFISAVPNPMDQSKGYLAPAELPITEGDDFIARALESASVPALMMSMIHITGSFDLLSGAIRPKTPWIAEVQGLLEESEKAEIRRLALDVLRLYRDSGCMLPPQPSPDEIQRMMNFLVGQEIAPEYVPMIMEELALDGRDARSVDLSAARPNGPTPLRVIVIGAGESGLLAAMRLEAEGVAYTVIEKNEHVGGTWHENRYPGCRVDVPSHFYSYSFAPNHGWTRFYAQRDELFEYFAGLARKTGVLPHIRFKTEVLEARWDDPTALWTVVVRNPDGTIGTLDGHVLISGVGQLNRPMMPEFPGASRFKGRMFHSARWPEDFDHTGKRVAVIGTGASAIQIVPEVAKTAANLDVFQRSGVWLFPNPHYHEPVSEEKAWLLRHVPFYARWYRFLLAYPGTDGSLPGLEIDPAWPHQERSVSAVNEVARNELIAHIRRQVPDNDALFAKVVPPYPPFIKRMNQDNGGWLRTLQQDHVSLVTAPIREFTEDGIIDSEGVLHKLDAVVFATGFHAGKFLWPMKIYGRGGRRLDEAWGHTPRAYLGITVPEFPNFFCLYGPATNLAHGGSIIFHSECQVRYALGAIRLLAESGSASIEVKKDVHDDFADRLRRRLTTLVWSHPGSGSWYKNPEGEVINTSPWRLVDYWQWTREPNPDDYILRIRADDP